MNDNQKTAARSVGAVLIITSVVAAIVNLGFWNPGILNISWLWNPLRLLITGQSFGWNIDAFLAVVWSTVLIGLGSGLCVASS
jgi:hypothetical protein